MPNDLTRRLDFLAGKLMPTTAFGKDAQTVLEASLEIERLREEIALAVGTLESRERNLADLARPEGSFVKLPPLKEGEEFGGSYDSGWNDCIRAAFQMPELAKRGDGSRDYILGWNEARAAICVPQEREGS